ncbi:hypothetical protein R6Q57_018011 [Mikania cordata]
MPYLLEKEHSGHMDAIPCFKMIRDSLVQQAEDVASNKISWLNTFLGYVLCLAFLPSLDNFGYELAWWVLVPLKHAINAYMDWLMEKIHAWLHPVMPTNIPPVKSPKHLLLINGGNGNGVLEREGDERERGYWDLRGNS